MKINEVIVEASMEINPKHRPFIQMAHKIRDALEPGSGIKWDDEEFNKVAELTTQLVRLGANFGPKTPAEALKNAGVDVEEFKSIIAKVQDAKKVGIADPEAPADEPEDDMDNAPDDDEIARQADMRARRK